VHRAVGDAWYQTAEFTKAADAYAAARKLVAGDPLANSDLLLKRSNVETRLGRPEKALTWIRRARTALKGLQNQEAIRQAARTAACSPSAPVRRPDKGGVGMGRAGGGGVRSRR
jgi:tetratricopeptide (TPR) repeat protein